jgi:hypothetical protein
MFELHNFKYLLVIYTLMGLETVHHITEEEQYETAVFNEKLCI